ncbi:MAG: YebC/PmpR family DNA-binding transcriptional regulator [Candidatus Vogelbacteria bacterium]|nr:YebC/PmpR family DNA-binding transcriptional regulator [Candidatus Vogelbacteria bacterium]
MSGHNKWSKIKNRKAITDSKKSKIFSMLAKNLTVESKKVKGDKNSPTLRAVIDRAKAANMPTDNIDRAIAKGAGADSGSFEEVIYEAYGPGGIAIIIEGITDNKNRTTPEIKHLLHSCGGSLGSQGSVLWAFSKGDEFWTPNNTLTLSEGDEEKLLHLLDILDDHDDIKNITTNADFSE